MTGERDDERSTAERVSAVLSGAVIALLLAVIGWLWVNDDEPAHLEVRTTEVRQVDAAHVEVTVDVTNDGDGTAVDVQVIGEIDAPEGAEQFGEQTLDFLTGGESETVVFIAPTADSALVVVRVGSYSRP